MAGGSELQQNETLAGDLTTPQVVKAMRTVASYATDAAEARDLLEMLGLVDADEYPGTGRHGTYERYVTGCRCPECTAANTRSHAAWKAGREAGEW